MVTLPLSSNRLYPTVGHVRVQVCRTGVSFPERFANPIRKRCITASGVTVRKIRRVPRQRGGLAVSEKTDCLKAIKDRHQGSSPGSCRTRQSSAFTHEAFTHEALTYEALTYETCPCKQQYC